jgi:hypothetical protein
LKQYFNDATSTSKQFARNLFIFARVFSKHNRTINTLFLCYFLDSSQRLFLEELDIFLSGNYYHERPQELLLATIWSVLLPQINREALEEGLARILKAGADCCARDGTDPKLSLLSLCGNMGELGILGKAFVQYGFDTAALFTLRQIVEKHRDKIRDEPERLVRHRLFRAFPWRIGCNVLSVRGIVLVFSLFLGFLGVVVGIGFSDAVEMGGLASVSDSL